MITISLSIVMCSYSKTHLHRFLCTTTSRCKLMRLTPCRNWCRRRKPSIRCRDCCGISMLSSREVPHLIKPSRSSYCEVVVSVCVAAFVCLVSLVMFAIWIYRYILHLFFPICVNDWIPYDYKYMHYFSHQFSVESCWIHTLQYWLQIYQRDGLM